jgi:hypothetical protein
MAASPGISWRQYGINQHQLKMKAGENESGSLWRK